jgi:hypothetical protein
MTAFCLSASLALDKKCHNLGKTASRVFQQLEAPFVPAMHRNYLIKSNSDSKNHGIAPRPDLRAGETVPSFQITQFVSTESLIVMSSQPSNFRRNDVKRAVQAVQAAGLKVGRVELHGGKVLIIPAGDEEVADDSNNSFDKIMRKPGAA